MNFVLMIKEIVLTADGSHTIAIPQMNVSYHSKYGAIQESIHVFIEAGLRYLTNQSVNLFEMGLGTGLNAFLTAIEAEKTQRKIYYTAVELFPLSKEEAKSLNYAEQLQHGELFQKIQECKWSEDVTISEFFTLRKENISLLKYPMPCKAEAFNLIYYDAFAPSAQPELWTKQIFEKLFTMLAENGVLVTYCSKGDVKRALMVAGFKATKLPGPKGKREMLRAEKIKGE
jgi:tRNA U34 5-methylaminomethyl-2-thiouridine-forming methyltransferase MnmC